MSNDENSRPSSYDSAPGNSKIEEVILTSFKNDKSLNIFPQIFEMHIYESIFSGFIRAELMIHDGIGLFYNFPITGEEFITIVMEGSNKADLAYNRDIFNRYFVIESIENIKFSDNGRHMIYKMNLINRLAYENEKTLVSHAYNNTTSEAALKIFYEYLVEPTNRTDFKNCNARFAKNIFSENEEDNPENETNESPESEDFDKPDRASIRSIINSPNPGRFLSNVLIEKITNFITPFFNLYDNDIHYGADQTDDKKIWVIPNLRPIDAILWLSNFANSSESLFGLNTKANGKYNNYVFFETLNGFFYTSIQKLVQIKKKTVNKDEPYIYVSNIMNADTRLKGSKRYKTIQSLRINNRYKVLNKISAGFFENNFIQINLLDLELSSTGDLKEFYSELEAEKNSDRILIGQEETNTEEYIRKVKGESTLPQYSSDPENINRTKYAFTDLNSLDGEKYTYRLADHWGETVRNASSMDEIDITISLPGDISLNAGDVIYCILPKIESYSDNSIEGRDDEFISGYFFITEATHSFQFGYHVTTLKINKDSYDLDIDEQEFLYNTRSSINNPTSSNED